ncbi:uncharacterized protein PAC_11833 [Phialocephala subalpina]|uniref:Uncharacterized protein n=1 Tax=Phialocephala subalpina TaxID=576137 RepID=A0A1L7XAC6_9HELO|nr:uncharacterized protein PAC_11833 [Phialocephala subalpina]
MTGTSQKGRGQARKKTRAHRNASSSPAMSTPKLINPINGAQRQPTNPTNPTSPSDLKKPVVADSTTSSETDTSSSSNDDDLPGGNYDKDIPANIAEVHRKESHLRYPLHPFKVLNSKNSPPVSAVQKIKAEKVAGVSAGVGEIAPDDGGAGGLAKVKGEKELKEKKKREYDMFHHLNSPSFFKPTPSSQEPWGDKDTSKKREDDIKHGRSVYKKWDGIQGRGSAGGALLLLAEKL